MHEQGTHRPTGRAGIERRRQGEPRNLGIGLPTLVAAFVPRDIDVYFHSENGIVGLSPLPGEGFEPGEPC